MAKKARKKYKELDFEPLEEFEDAYADDPDLKELSSGMQDSDWDDSFDVEDQFSARRKIERRNDMKKLYSQLDEWEQFGDRVDW